ncbi:MAG TPA: hypothetical protein VJL89_01170 [Thermodesulfovibrionia bacterium]|nr:hypothetical protein [Thermodesulfovibrionia bacterium]
MMFKVKTFGIDLQPFKTMKALSVLDEMVNDFLKNNSIKKVVSVSDTLTTDDKGETIGLIRVISYEE